eukprot:IDg18724t1
MDKELAVSGIVVDDKSVLQEVEAAAAPPGNSAPLSLMPFFGLPFGGRANSSDSYEFQSSTNATSGSTYLQEGETRAGAVSTNDGNPVEGGRAPYPHVPFSEEYTVQPRTGQHMLPRFVWGGTVPRVVVKLRKRLHPLGITRLTAGLDVDVQSGAVAFKWAWTDRLFGGRLSIERQTLAFSKSLPVPDMRAALDLRAAFDLRERRTLFSVAVRPLTTVIGAAGNGVALRQRIPLDKRLDLEVFARVMLP